MSDYEKWQRIAAQQTTTPAPASPDPPQRRESNILLAVVAVAAVILALDQLYLHRQVSQFNSLGRRLEAQSAAREGALNKQVEERLAALDRATRRAIEAGERATASQPEATVANLDDATRRQLNETKAMTEKLQAEQHQEASNVARALAKKADQKQVGALSDDVSATRRDLDATQKSLRQTVEGLGMARSEFGTLTGRNHDEIAQLRRLGERDYYEFALERSNRSQRVGGVGLELRKTDAKRQRYTLRLLVDDYVIEKKDRTVNEPIFFYTSGRERPLELVVNRIQKGRISGYVSAPKGVAAGHRRVTATDNGQWEPFKEIKRGEQGDSQGAKGGNASGEAPNL
ncbi:MAG TPA: hypothetical protein VG204_05735 [Terriglobia bacterium]|nr:hypothetical protein [Terriglobia bacterium]